MERGPVRHAGVASDLPDFSEYHDRFADADIRKRVSTGVRTGQFAVVVPCGRGSLFVLDDGPVRLQPVPVWSSVSPTAWRLPGIAGLLAAPAVWSALGTVPLLWERAARWLNGVPAVLFCLLTVVALVLYVLELHRFCRRYTEGGTIYALG